jgi:hypothetical protein
MPTAEVDHAGTQIDMGLIEWGFFHSEKVIPGRSREGKGIRAEREFLLVDAPRELYCE